MTDRAPALLSPHTRHRPSLVPPAPSAAPSPLPVLVQWLPSSSHKSQQESNDRPTWISLPPTTSPASLLDVRAFLRIVEFIGRLWLLMSRRILFPPTIFFHISLLLLSLFLAVLEPVAAYHYAYLSFCLPFYTYIYAYVILNWERSGVPRRAAAEVVCTYDSGKAGSPIERVVCAGGGPGQRCGHPAVITRPGWSEAQ